MARFAAIGLDEVPASTDYGVPGRATSAVTWSKRLSPHDYSLFLVVSELPVGAELRWAPPHGDEAVCVLEGALDVDGHVAPAGGAVVIESGVMCTARPVGPTVVAHYGPTDINPPTAGPYGPPAKHGHVAHVVGDKGWYRTEGDTYDVTWWADSTCPTCRASVFRVDHTAVGDGEVAHHHSQDEIIFVLHGELQMGAHSARAGTALSIPANMRYAPRARAPYSFLNFRRDASMVTLAGGAEARLEAARNRTCTEMADFR